MGLRDCAGDRARARHALNWADEAAVGVERGLGGVVIAGQAELVVEPWLGAVSIAKGEMGVTAQPERPRSGCDDADDGVDDLRLPVG